MSRKKTGRCSLYNITFEGRCNDKKGLLLNDTPFCNAGDNEKLQLKTQLKYVEKKDWTLLSQ